MVVRCSPALQGHSPSEIGKRNEGYSKPLRSKLNSPKSKTQLSMTSSPSKTPLTSSSLANINRSSPLKPRNILPRTPDKQSSLPRNSPSKTHPSQNRTEENYLCAFSTPSSDSSSSILTDSPPSVVKVEKECWNGSPTDDLFVPHSLIESGSINDGSNSTGSCGDRAEPSTRDRQREPPVSRRNARERNRVKQVSLGFAILRQHVPNANRKKKLSKVETLRCAVEYIKNLQALLQENPSPLYNHTSSCTTPSSSMLPKVPPKYFQSELPSDLLHVPNHARSDVLNCPTSTPSFSPHVRVSPVLGSYEANHPAFYGGRRQLPHTPGGSSCLEPQLLKVPKVEPAHFQSPAYSTSLFTIPAASYTKTSPMSMSTSPSDSLEDLSPLQDMKDPSLPAGIHPEVTEFISCIPPKDLGDVDLMEALAWWQQNVQ